MPNKQPVIRFATSVDAIALAGFNRAMARETENLKLMPATSLAGVQSVFKEPALGFYLVTEMHDQLIASLMVTTEWSDWRNGLFWWIQSVYVVPEWRRRGVYRSLYQHVVKLAECDETVCGFRLYVEHENHTAQQTYTTLGMHKVDYHVFEQSKSTLDFAFKNKH